VFCLSGASQTSNGGPILSPREALDIDVASPQGLLIDPEELRPRVEYFPATLDLKKASNRKPMLLLVEDNHINLKVSLALDKYRIVSQSIIY
jgi:hypothetical protein